MSNNAQPFCYFICASLSIRCIAPFIFRSYVADAYCIYNIYIYYVCLTLCLIIAHSHHQIPKKPTSHSFQNFHRKRTTSCSLPCTPRSYGTSLPNLLQNLPFFVFACLIQLPLPLHLMMNMHFCSQAKARVRTPAPKTQRGMFGVEFGICRMFGCKL